MTDTIKKNELYYSATRIEILVARYIKLSNWYHLQKRCRRSRPKKLTKIRAGRMMNMISFQLLAERLALGNHIDVLESYTYYHMLSILGVEGT